MQNPSPANGSFEKALARREFDGKDPSESRVSGYGGAGTEDTHGSRTFVSPFLLVDNVADRAKSDDTGSDDNLHNEARGDEDGSFEIALARREFDGKYPSESHVSGYGGAGTEDTHRSRTSGSPFLVDNIADRAKSDDTGSGDNLHNEARDDHNATEVDRSTLTTSTSRPIRNETARRAHQLSNIAQLLESDDDDRDKPAEINAKPPEPSSGDLRPTVDLIGKNRSDRPNLLVLDESLDSNAYKCDAKSLHASPDTRPSLRLDNNQEKSHRRKRSNGVSDTHSVISIVMNANKGIVTPENERRQLGFNKEERDECPRTPKLHAPEIVSRLPYTSIEGLLDPDSSHRTLDGLIHPSFDEESARLEDQRSYRESDLTESQDLNAPGTMETEKLIPEAKGTRHVEIAISHTGTCMLVIGVALFISGYSEFASTIDVEKGLGQVEGFQLSKAISSCLQMITGFVTLCFGLCHVSQTWDKEVAVITCWLTTVAIWLYRVSFALVIYRMIEGWSIIPDDSDANPRIIGRTNDVASIFICMSLTSGLAELTESQKKLYNDRGIDLDSKYFAANLGVYSLYLFIAGLCQVAAACYIWSVQGINTSEMASAGSIFVVSYAPISFIAGLSQVLMGTVGILAAFGHQMRCRGYDAYLPLLFTTAALTAGLQFVAQISVARGDDHVLKGTRGLVLYFGIFIMLYWAYIMKKHITEDPRYFYIGSDTEAEPMQFGVLRLVAQVRAWCRKDSANKQSPCTDREITLRTTRDDDDTVSDDAPIGDFAV